MKKYIVISLFTALSIVPFYVFADKVTVKGTTYECSNSCSIEMGPPMTIADCCGGTVAKLQRGHITID